MGVFVCVAGLVSRRVGVLVLVGLACLGFAELGSAVASGRTNARAGL